MLGTKLILLLALFLCISVAPRAAEAQAADIAAVQASLGDATYGLVWLQLTTYAYLNQSNKAKDDVVTVLPAKVATLPAIPLPSAKGPTPLPLPASSTLPGKWQVEWGPAYTGANLMYAASYRAASDNSPVFLAVVIRGTDIAAGGAAVLKQVLQDFEACYVVDWDSNVLNCKKVAKDAGKLQIAKGSCDGMKALLALSSDATDGSLGKPVTGITLIPFLDAFKAKFPTVPVVVTGHSLGGTQTTAIAQYLSDNWAKGTTVITAHPIAPATAGTALWAARYSTTFKGKSQSYINSLDLVPMGFGQVKNVSTLWGDYGGAAAPFYIKDIVKYLDCASGKGYMQPDSKAIMRGSVPQESLTYVKTLMYEHFPPYYMALMCQNLVYANQSVNYIQQLPNSTDIVNGCTVLPKDANGNLYNPGVIVPEEGNGNGLVGEGGSPFDPFQNVTEPTAEGTATATATASVVPTTSSKPGSGSKVVGSGLLAVVVAAVAGALVV